MHSLSTTRRAAPRRATRYPASMAIASLAMPMVRVGQGGERQWGDQADARTDGRRGGE
jgi:hypothetical protein